jgi:acyl-homoserine-lactone acylase
VLPQLLNPKTGYLQNANNGFEFTTLKQSVDMSAFPAALRRQRVLSLRAQNSLQALESRPRFALDDVTRAVFDNHVPLAARVKPQLLALIKNDPAATADVKAAAALVEEWNDRLAPDSAGAALFASWWADYDQEVDEGSHKVFARPWDRSDPLQTPSGIGEPAVATRAFASVVEKFKKAFGRIDVPWSQVYRIRRGSLELPAPGGTEDFGLLDTLEFKNDDAVKRSVNWGTSYLLTVEFAGAPVAYSLVPYSESADARSAHYTDQTSLFARSATKRLWTTESDVEKHTVRRYSPGK